VEKADKIKRGGNLNRGENGMTERTYEVVLVVEIDTDSISIEDILQGIDQIVENSDGVQNSTLTSHEI